MFAKNPKSPCPKSPTIHNSTGSKKAPVMKKRGTIAEAGRRMTMMAASIRSMSGRGLGKTTKMLLLISIIYVVTYLPLLSVMVTKFTDKRKFIDLSESERYMYFFCVNCIYMGCATNPVIYSFFDASFRTRCRQLLFCRK